VHFLELANSVGCREQELLPADAPWQIDSEFEFGDWVAGHQRPGRRRANCWCRPGMWGAGDAVRRDLESGLRYEVLFCRCRLLQVPALGAISPAPWGGETMSWHGYASLQTGAGPLQPAGGTLDGAQRAEVGAAARAQAAVEEQVLAHALAVDVMPSAAELHAARQALHERYGSAEPGRPSWRRLA
jgi:hypothetical protein